MKLDQAGQDAVLNDARYQDIGNLPSNFIPYEFKKLMIRPFTIKELKLVGKAGLLHEDYHMVRAVDLCLDQPAEELTTGDYFYILLWLKVHSSPKTPYVIDWKCPARVWTHKITGATISNKGDPEAPEQTRTNKITGAPVLETDPEDPDNWELKPWELVPCETSNTELIH